MRKERPMKRETQAELHAAMLREQKEEMDAYLRRWTAFMRQHMRNYDRSERRACTIRAKKH